jgi:ParB-like chromosome segregation protein Spo0J
MIEITIKTVKLSAIKLNPDNPRRIGKIEMARLVKSLQDFPDMMKLREIIVDETMTILGGNMRYRALKQIGEKEVTAKIVKGLTPEQKREFVIKDNSGFGEFDLDALANGWSDLPLVEWGLDLPEDWLGEPNFEPATEAEQGRLDEKEPTVCPACGHSWVK